MVKSDSELFNPFEMSDIYNDYVSFYNDSGKAKTDLIKAMSELSIILSTVEKHEDEFTADCQDVLKRLIDLLSDIPQKDSNGQSDKNIIMNALLSYFESNDINSKVIPDNLHNIDYLINVIHTLSPTLDSKKKQIMIQLSLIELKILQPSFVENHKHKVSLKRVTRKIISGLYPEQLPYFNELSEDEKSEMSSNSNAEKLSVAYDWLFPIITAISSLEEPTHELILEVIQKEFPEFKCVPGEEDLSFIKGLNNINKTSIDKALRYLFIERHNKIIAKGTIKRTLNGYGMW